jgi:hypothetical protein
MSALSFSAALRERIKKKLIDRGETVRSEPTSNIGALIRDSSEDSKKYRKKLEGTKGIYESIYTKEGLQHIVDKLSQEADQALVFSFQKFQQTLVEQNPNTILNKVQDIPDPFAIQKNTDYDTAKNTVSSYLKNTYKDISPAIIDKVMSLFNAGHIAGLASKRIVNTFYDASPVDSSGRIALQKDTEYIDRVLQLLLDLDLATTNSIEADYGIYANSIKNLGSNELISIELQLASPNQEAGRKIASVMTTLSKISKELVSHAGTTISGEVPIFTKANIGTEDVKKWMQEQLNGIKNDTVKALAQKNYDWLLKMEGSPSLYQMIENKILKILDPKQTKEFSPVYTLSNINILEGQIKLLDTKEFNKLSKELIKKLKKEKQTIKKVLAQKGPKNPLRTNTGQFTSLTSLQNLLNSRLAAQIQKNMGKGNARAVLNYRTGRFANSAKVERLSMARDGAITAFYSYMKNPYQTFEPGFKQGSPQSRDPRLLIGRSIREIAAQAVSARMKAISV